MRIVALQTKPLTVKLVTKVQREVICQAENMRRSCLASTVLIKYHALDGIDQRRLLPYNSKGRSSTLGMSAWGGSGEGSLPGLHAPSHGPERADVFSSSGEETVLLDGTAPLGS